MENSWGIVVTTASTRKNKTKVLIAEYVIRTFYVSAAPRPNYYKYDIINMKHSLHTFMRSFVLAAVLVLQGVLASAAYAIGVGGGDMPR